MIRTNRYWLPGIALFVLAVSLTGCASSQASRFTGSSWPGITATDDAIYLAAGAQVFAIDPEINSELWVYPSEADRTRTFYAAPAVDDDIVVVTDYTDMLHVLNRANGSLRWTFETDNARFIGSAVIGDEMIYAGAVNGVVYALDREEGSTAWTFATERDIWSTPLLDDGTLYVTSLDRHLYALDAATGDLQWQFPANGTELDPEMGAIVGTPSTNDGVLYFGSFNNHVYALDIETRDILWSYETENWVWSSPTFDEETGRLVGADLDGNVFALDASTGEEQWVFDARGPVVGAPILFDREDGQRVAVVSVGTAEGDNVHVLNIEDGTKAVSSVSVEAEFTSKFLFFNTNTSNRSVVIYAPPVLYGDLLLIGDHQSTYQIHALDRETMLERWTFSSVDS
ncbi:MAG: PQQ-like beta-propeller repeat protein [Anaerolineae bacterium]|nr:PQQ-like beta-propeller repeat protein [Anaerolineae bacterium]